MPVLFLFIAAWACQATGQLDSSAVESFTEFRNDNTLAMGIDGTVIPDKFFVIKVPGRMQGHSFLGTNTFRHLLEFTDDEKIILLYIPTANTSSDFRFNRLSYNQFIKLCNKENIIEDLEGIELKRTRYFGISKVENGSFFAIYLNIKSSHTREFNYSIGSVIFSTD